MTEEQCEFYKECECDCNGAIEKTECCECYRLHNFIKMLIGAINQGTKKFEYEEAPFLHEAMAKYFTFCTGLNIDELEDL